MYTCIQCIHACKFVDCNLGRHCSLFELALLLFSSGGEGVWISGTRLHGSLALQCHAVLPIHEFSELAREYICRKHA